jgi:predicted nucleotidyltransferase
VRLTPAETRAIREEVNRFDPLAEVYLFGSRTDDAARGGDVDLWVVSPSIGEEDALRLKIRIRARLDGRRVDLLVNPGQDHPLATVVAETGIRL